jgi:hypothetical protein
MGSDGDKTAQATAMEHAMKEVTGSLVWPMLTRANYYKWALLIQINLEGMWLWDAIESIKVERRPDHLALAALIQGVPKEMHSTLAGKKSAKEAWDAVSGRRSHQGGERPEPTERV